MGGGVPSPPPRNRGEDFRVGANQVLHPREEKGRGHPLAIRRQLLAGAGLGGDWLCGEGLDLDADLVCADGHGGFQTGGGEPGGGDARVVHGIASRPKSKPKPAATPAGGPPQPHPPNPRDAFAKALGAISPAPDRQGTVS